MAFVLRIARAGQHDSAMPRPGDVGFFLLRKGDRVSVTQWQAQFTPPRVLVVEGEVTDEGAATLEHVEWTESHG